MSFHLDQVVCEDARIYLSALPDATIDMALTSPPYDNLRTYDSHDRWQFEPIAHELYRVLKPGGVLVWVVGDATIDNSETLTSAEQKIYFRRQVGFNIHDTMIYQKTGAAYHDSNRYRQEWEYMFVLAKGKPKTCHLQVQRNRYAGHWRQLTVRKADGSLRNDGKRQVKEYGVLGNVWQFAVGFGNSSSDPSAFEHPAIFPEKLAERHIVTWSNPGEIVLDCFMGSGTTALIARKLGRHFMGCDVNEDYVALANRRLAKPYTLPMMELME